MVESTEAAPPTPDPVSLCELGVLGVETDGEWTAVRGQLAPVLLVALALAGPGGLRSEELVEIIWPSPDQPATARKSLANIVLRVRAAHGASLIESTRRGYRIGVEIRSDRDRFVADVERAAEVAADAPDRALKLVDGALARWRGEPWVGIERPIGVESDRARLLQMHDSAQRVRVGALVALNHRDPAATLLREMLETDPFDEYARHQLVRIQTDRGQRAEALRSIQVARDAFASRGLVLDAGLVEVEQRLLSESFVSDARPQTLPAHATEFVGREREAEAIADELRVNRLVTLVGIGGSGKTRLAVHVASTFDEGAGAGFVDLARARSTGEVELAFARGLGLPHTRLEGLSSEERRKTLAHAASAWAGILVVDNCEHVLPDVQAVMRGLLAELGPLRVLATSRTPLEVESEYRYPLPTFGHGVELFARRSAQHGVHVDLDHQAETVSDVCELVDHLPLAIEIAAAQTPYRTVQEIADELRHGVVHRDPSKLEPRHETMSAAIRWSHERLPADEADALVKLGIFAGLFQQDDAAAVTQADDIRGVLDALVRSSLIERLGHHGRSSYRLPVPVQQYSAAELARNDTTAEAALSLAEWLLEFTDRPYGDVLWRLSTVDEIAGRLPDALAAVTTLRNQGRTDDATLLAGRLSGAAREQGQAGELMEVLSELWPDCDNAEATADALAAIVRCADITHRHDVRGPALGLLDAIDGPAGRRHRVFVHCEHTLWMSMTAMFTDGDYGPASDQLELARKVDEGLDSPVNRAAINKWQSAIHLLEGDWSAAEAAARQALIDSAGTYDDATATSCLCHARLHQADPDLALDLATRHPERNRRTSYGHRLRIVAAIARVQRGETDDGLDEISDLLHTAQQTPFDIHQQDLAISVAYISHLLGRDELTLQILETGISGYGPWIGYLAPKMCRDLGIPLTLRFGTVEQNRSISTHAGVVAARVLEELTQPRTRLGTAPS